MGGKEDVHNTLNNKELDFFKSLCCLKHIHNEQNIKIVTKDMIHSATPSHTGPEA